MPRLKSPIVVKFVVDKPETIAAALTEKRYESKKLYDLRLQTEHISLLNEFDKLLCLEHLPNIKKLWYQIETVRKTLRLFNGRVLLADEVGLGKTIEAGMLIKEYLLRGLISRVLVLTPSSLVTQWQQELKEKCGLSFFVPPPNRNHPWAQFWNKENFIICSLNAAKSKNTFALVTNSYYDLVVVDEAHHLKNNHSLNWKLVNALQKRFIFLLTATPVQNSLIELYNLITLLKPGQLKTQHFFKSNFVEKGNLKRPKNKKMLRELLSEVMIRNTRSVVNIGLPKRWAQTYIVQPSSQEQTLYRKLSEFVRYYHREPRKQIEPLTLMTLQKEVGSSPHALLKTLKRIQARIKLAPPLQKGTSKTNHPDIHREQPVPTIRSLIRLAKTITSSSKAGKLLETIRKNPSEKIIVFTQYQATLRWLTQFLAEKGISTQQFHSGLSARQKDKAIELFKTTDKVLLTTESGGEGKNLQFCRTMVNFDLPWNPMRIEQRIGRIHRFGQTREVFIFNLALKNSIEEYLLRLLDEKINMFELVVGEIDMILGNLGEHQQEFGKTIMDIWTRQTAADIKQGFQELETKLLNAKEKYLQSQELDHALFNQDYQL